MAQDDHQSDESHSSRERSSADTRIIRRAPLSASSQPLSDLSEPPTRGHTPPSGNIIRRHPTGEIPTTWSEPPTAAVSADPARDAPPRAQPVAVGPSRAPSADPNPAIVTSIVSILSGWATAVIATNLITGWWGTDLLFCIAVGFLAAISAAGTIGGVIALLLRRRIGRLLIVVGSVVAMLIFASLFLAGAKLPAVVYAMPLLPLASIGLAMLPDTARWSRTG
ncbi:hypothetical protein NGTWS1803_31420 [Mycolicibacterium cyprinidarum]|nr:hypothetical protein NGTWS1803_31420 [Mycolicibacterium sp. NGTWS1803]